MRFKPEEIAGYYADDELYCAECLELGNAPEIEDPEAILTEDEVEKTEDLIFCDICKERISHELLRARRKAAVRPKA